METKLSKLTDQIKDVLWFTYDIDGEGFIDKIEAIDMLTKILTDNGFAQPTQPQID